MISFMSLRGSGRSNLVVAGQRSAHPPQIASACRKRLLAMTGVALALTLLACAPAAAPSGGAESRLASGSSELPQEWTDAVAKAKEEGKVVVVMGGAASRTWRPLFEKFRARFGIDVEASGGGGGESADRVLAERQAGVYSVDVWMTGLTTTNSRIIPAGGLEPINNTFILPEVKDDSKWWQGRKWYGDIEQKYIFLFNGSPTPDIAYNTNLVKNPDEIKSYFDLLDPKWKGKITGIDPTIEGVGAIYAFYHLNPQVGTDYLRRMFKEQDITFYRDLRQAAESLAQGKFSIFMFEGSGRIEVENLKNQGLPVEFIYRPLKEGNRLAAGGAATISMMSKAAHPNAAKVFINWALSKEGQEAANEVSDTDASLREDVSMEKIRPEYRREPGANYLFYDADPKFQAFLNEVLKLDAQLLQEAGKR